MYIMQTGAGRQLYILYSYNDLLFFHSLYEIAIWLHARENVILNNIFFPSIHFSSSLPQSLTETASKYAVT